MRVSKFGAAMCTAAALAGGAVLMAGTVAGVSVTPGVLTIPQGGNGSFSASLDSFSGGVPPKAKNPPNISFCAEWTIHDDGTTSCDATSLFSLEKGRNYSQLPVLLGEYANTVAVNVDTNAPCNTAYVLDETFTALEGSGVDFGTDVLQVSRPVTVTVTCAATMPVFAGCSHGYWKNHGEVWPSPYTPGTKLGQVFSLPSFAGALSNKSLDDALRFKGGDTTLEKAEILLRNAVAAVLNSAHASIDYEFSTAEVLSLVNAALASADADTMLTLEETLDVANHGSPFCGDGE